MKSLLSRLLYGELHGRSSNRRPHSSLVVEQLEDRCVPSTFTVVNILDSGPGSLRQAVLDANAAPNVGGVPDLINFNIPGGGVHTIALVDPMRITDGVKIDGYSQPGAIENSLAVGSNAQLKIEVDCSAVNAAVIIFSGGGGSTVRGLVLNRAPFNVFHVGLSAVSNNNTIAGNYIGTDPTGMEYVGAGFYSIMTFSEGTTIGGPTPADRNVIAGGIFDTSVGLTAGAVVQGNYLGINAAGTAALTSDSFFGVVATERATIVDNVIVATAEGIELGGGENLVRGNRIGTDATGTVGLGAGTGIRIGNNGVNNTISDNLISGGTIGIHIDPFPSIAGLVIQGNKIGTDINGTAAIPNSGDGIKIGGPGGATIGGTNPGEGNVIAFNGGAGISMSNSPTGYAILGNSIHSNGGLGIALNGGNGGQTAPVITSSSTAAGQTTIAGTLSSTPNTTFRLEFFANDAADSTGFGEGQTFLGFKDDVRTDDQGNAGFNVTFANPGGSVISATATDPAGNTSEFSATAAATVTGRRPVLIVPDIGGSYVADLQNERNWLLNLGVAPDQLRIDPLSGTYDALIETLKHAGYVEGRDLFIAPYDWRLAIAPDDGVIDGKISGLTAALSPSDPSLISLTDNHFKFGVDYLGHWLRQAAEAWAASSDAPLDAVDVIAHGAGGLIARAYIESDAYGASFNSPAFGALPLPKINNFIMVGVPNRGMTLPWNPLHNNFSGDPKTQFIFSSVIDRAYKQVVDAGATIGGPSPITRASILDGNGEPSPERFIKLYMPAFRTLLATYDFLNTSDGQHTNLNQKPDERNNVILDLNNANASAGDDLNADKGKSNDFAEKTQATAIDGENKETSAEVSEFQGETAQQASKPLGNIVPFDNFPGRHAGSNEKWYQDAAAEAKGDGTVPAKSSQEQFVGDSRVQTVKFRTADATGPGNTDGDISHDGLVSNKDVQRTVLDTLGKSVPDDQIITQGSGAQPDRIAASVGFPENILEKLHLQDLVELFDKILIVKDELVGKSLDVVSKVKVAGKELAEQVKGNVDADVRKLLGVLHIGAGTQLNLDLGPLHLEGNFIVEINTGSEDAAVKPPSSAFASNRMRTLWGSIIDGSFRSANVAGTSKSSAAACWGVCVLLKATLKVLLVALRGPRPSSAVAPS